jgi:hypothetical protein
MSTPTPTSWTVNADPAVGGGRLTTIPHDFELIDDNRAGLVLTGSIRLDPRLRNGAGAIQLKADALGDYPTAGDHYVVTELYRPQAVLQWIGFQVDITHVSDTGTQLTGDGYRLSDGASHYFWNGSTWAITSAAWNTEAEIAANIGVFPVTARQLQVVIRLTTSDKAVTPVLRTVHIAWKGRVEALEDIVYRTLAPLLKTTRVIIDFAIKMAASSTTLDVKAAVVSSGLHFDVVGVDSAYNKTTDPNQRTDLLQTFNASTGIATLGTAVGAGQFALCRLIVRPQVAILSTAQDYIELEAAPALQIKDIESSKSQPLAVSSAVVNKATRDAIVIPPPYRFNLRFTMIALAPGGVDLMRFLRAVTELVEANPIITATATGKQHRFWMVEEFANTTTPQDSNLHSYQAIFEISDILSYERQAQQTKAVGAFTPNLSSI